LLPVSVLLGTALPVVPVLLGTVVEPVVFALPVMPVVPPVVFALPVVPVVPAVPVAEPWTVPPADMPVVWSLPVAVGPVVWSLGVAVPGDGSVAPVMPCALPPVVPVLGVVAEPCVAHGSVVVEGVVVDSTGFGAVVFLLVLSSARLRQPNAAAARSDAKRTERVNVMDTLLV
jgi:hypothetical protein